MHTRVVSSRTRALGFGPTARGLEGPIPPESRAETDACVAPCAPRSQDSGLEGGAVVAYPGAPIIHLVQKVEVFGQDIGWGWGLNTGLSVARVFILDTTLGCFVSPDGPFLSWRGPRIGRPAFLPFHCHKVLFPLRVSLLPWTHFSTRTSSSGTQLIWGFFNPVCTYSCNLSLFEGLISHQGKEYISHTLPFKKNVYKAYMSCHLSTNSTEYLHFSYYRYPSFFFYKNVHHLGNSPPVLSSSFLLARFFPLFCYVHTRTLRCKNSLLVSAVFRENLRSWKILFHKSFWHAYCLSEKFQGGSSPKTSLYWKSD